MNESTVQKHIRLAAKEDDCLLLRQNSGALKDVTGRLVRFGLANESRQMNEQFKSGDLIGVKAVVVTPDMVGKTVGVFVSVESKTEGWTYKGTAHEQGQDRWRAWVASYGGFAGFAASVEEARRIWNK